ncbi:MAG: transposase [Candidatus Gracilibacteria bacterium]|nr:transposase [Candidatus Gracilibacteria bacterium]
MRKRLFITWVTHNSRYNEKMKLLKLEKSEGYFLDDKNRVLIYNLISEKLEKEGIKSYTLNVLSDHVHLVFMYKENDLSEFIRKIKGFVSFKYSKIKSFTEKGDGRQNKIWARGYSITYLDNDEHYKKAVEYTLKNHLTLI